MEEYGVAVYPRGVELHQDGRLRRKSRLGPPILLPPFPRHNSARGPIEGFTAQSRKRLSWTLANALIDFAQHITLTYHARVDESDGDEVARRNLALVERAKADLNRLLATLRNEVGRYVWIQEFQKRGAIHFHLLVERACDERRIAVAWCRVTDQLHDPHAIAHSVKAQAVDDQTAARKYLIKYFGKGRQKSLPSGVQRAGRYWGASRSLRADPLVEVWSAQAKALRHDADASRVQRCVRKYLARTLGFRFRSGRLVFWSEDMPQRLLRVISTLREFFRDSGFLIEWLANHDWEPVEAEVVKRQLAIENVSTFDGLDWL